MPKSNVLTAGGAANKKSSNTNTNTTSTTTNSSAILKSSTSVSQSPSSSSSSSSLLSTPTTSSSDTIPTGNSNTMTGIARENRPPPTPTNIDSFDDDDQISFDDDEEEDMEKQMLLHSTSSEGLSNDDELNAQLDDLYNSNNSNSNNNHHNGGHGGGNNHHETIMNNKGTIVWICICFFGIMFSFVGYGLLLEYATSGGRKLHELSFLFVTSLLYTVTAAAGRYVRDETPTTIPPARFAVLGITSMGSTFCSVRSLRYVIFPIQVLAKSCKPVPVMLMGAIMGKKYPLRKYINVIMIVLGVALFMGGGSTHKKAPSSTSIDGNDDSGSMQIFGIILLFISLCFDGGTGAYEDKLMAVHHVGPFDLMYNIQLGKTIIAGVGLVIFNQVHVFLRMCQEMGFVLVALGVTGALGQVFIFITIAKFGALTCSIIGLARKVTTLLASIYIYGHILNLVQGFGLFISVAAMVMNFMGKKDKKKGHGGAHGGNGDKGELPTVQYRDDADTSKSIGDVELPTKRVQTLTVGGGR